MEKWKRNHLWKYNKIAVWDIRKLWSRLSLTHTSDGSIKDFQNIFLSGILDKAESLWAQKFVWGSHFISIWTHVTSFEKFYWQAYTYNLWNFLSRCLAELETLVKKPICSQLKSIFVAEVRTTKATKESSSYFYFSGCWSSNHTINCLQLWLLFQWQRRCLRIDIKLFCKLFHRLCAVCILNSSKHFSATSRKKNEIVWFRVKEGSRELE